MRHSTPTKVSENWQGAVFMLLAMAGYGLNDLAVKIVATHLSAATILVFRSLLAAFLLLLILFLRRELVQIRPGLRARALLRSGVDALMTMSYVYALTGMSLANAAAIYQLTPAIFMLASAILLRETIPLGCWVGVGLGFFGMVLVIRPDAGILDTHVLAVLIAVGCAVARDLLMRGRAMPPPFCLALYSAVCTMIIGLGAGLAEGGLTIPSPASLAPLLLAAAAIATGYVFLARATVTGSSGFVSPFRYSILIFAVIFGAIALGEYPDMTTLIGIVIILISGVIVGLTNPL